MAYSPTTDFLALLRLTSGGVRTERMPGLDYVVAALARAGLFTLFVGQTAPTTNQAGTVWLLPASPSWTAEGLVFLWNPGTLEYEVATPALWATLLSTGGVFQSVAGAAGVVGANTSLLAIQRANPAATALTLPSVTTRFGKALQLVDWSTAVANHTVTITPAGAETIMLQPSWQILSTAVQLAGVTLRPSTDLNGWVIAP